MRIREWLALIPLCVPGCGAPSEPAPVDTTVSVADLPSTAAYDRLEVDIGEPSARRYLGENWSWDETQGEDERSFVWATGTSATMWLPLTPGKPLAFEAVMSTWEDADHAPEPITVLLNGEEVATIEPARGWRTVRFTLPGTLATEGKLTFAHTQHMEVEGRRPVASAWDRIRITSAGIPTRTESKDLGTPGQRDWLGYGWSHDETHADGTTFVWSDGPTSTFRIPRALQGASKLRVRMRSLPDPEKGKPQILRLALGDQAIGEIRVGTEWSEYDIPIPKDALSNVRTELTASYAFTVKPAAHGESTDVRDLAIAWDWLSLEPRPREDAVDAGASTRMALRLPPGARLALAPSDRPETPSSLLVTVTDPATGDSRHHHLGRGGDIELAPWDDDATTVALTLRHPSSKGAVELSDLTLTVGADADLAVSRPDVIVFVADSLRADHTSTYGFIRETTPELTRFAKTGTLFTRAQAQASWTRPASASLLTGLLPRQHGATDRDDTLAPRTRTTAEVLASLGYETAAFVANGNVGEASGLGQGFDHFREAGGVGAAALPGAAAELVDEVLDWLDSRVDSDRPLFLYVHVVDPHGPYLPPPEWRDRYASGVPMHIGTSAWIADTREGRTDVTREAIQPALDLYDAEIAYTDAAFGRFIDGLDQRARGEDAVVLFTSDHGEEFQDHGGMEHGRTLFREMLDVPFVLRAPGMKPDVRLPYPAQHIDVLPTVLHAIGAPVPETLPGQPLQSVDADAPRTTFAHLDLDGRKAESAVRWPHKLIRSIDGSSAPQWFDLGGDPLEQAPSGVRPAEAAALDTELDRHTAAADTRPSTKPIPAQDAMDPPGD